MADALLRRDEIGLLFKQSSNKPIVGLTEARVSVLALGSDPYLDALDYAVEAETGAPS